MCLCNIYVHVYTYIYTYVFVGVCDMGYTRREYCACFMHNRAYILYNEIFPNMTEANIKKTNDYI